jgi:predicted O-methyltransferase YrrM
MGRFFKKNMNITEYLIEKSKGLIKQVAEYRDEGYGYTAFNDGSIECEVGDFLYGMVRILKPRFVLESGTYKGISSSYIAQGLEDNKTGMIETFEIEQQHIETSKQLWSMLGLMVRITSYHMPIESFNPSHGYELMFLDSEPHLRFHELVKFFPNLLPGGYVFIHDCPRSMTQGNVNPDHPEIESWPFGPIPTEMKNWLKDGELIKFHFPSPRGMVGFYKKHGDDHKII